MAEPKRPQHIWKKLIYFKAYRKAFRRSLVGDIREVGLVGYTLFVVGATIAFLILLACALQLLLIEHKTFMAMLAAAFAAIVLVAVYITGRSNAGKMPGFIAKADEEGVKAQREEEREHPDRYR